MTFPADDGYFLLLLALATGQGVEVQNGEMVLALDSGPVPVRGPWLDWLEERQYVEVGEDILVTDKGSYWLQRQMARRVRAAGYAGKYRFAGAKLSRHTTTHGG